MEVTDEQSKGNQFEVDIVELHVKALTEPGVEVKDIAVIALYNLQVGLLHQKLSAGHPELEIKSADWFHGREKEAVVLSLVGSNRERTTSLAAEAKAGSSGGSRDTGALAELLGQSGEPGSGSGSCQRRRGLMDPGLGNRMLLLAHSTSAGSGAVWFQWLCTGKSS
ncbi:hypothetical protein Q8A73_001681 [Channa argus]|nr:hypothetical protein Q8A73_001681 [Channa argus]